MSISNRAGQGWCVPLLVASWALGELPVVVHEGLEIVVVPGGWCGVPCTFETCGGGVLCLAGLPRVLPANKLLLHWSARWFWPNCVFWTCTVHLAKGVSTHNQRNGLLVVHGHAAEGLADVATGRNRIRVGVGAFRVHVDEPHLYSAKWFEELSVARVTLIVEPYGLGSPVDVLFWSPHVLAAASEPERGQAHRFQGDIAGQDHEICPRNATTVLLLNWLEQKSCFIEVAVVWPAVEWFETLGSRCATAATIVGAVGASGVPCHANEERPVVSVIGGPPVLGVGH